MNHRRGWSTACLCLRIANTTLPIGVGMGSSAALMVTLSTELLAGLAQLVDTTVITTTPYVPAAFDLTTINAWAFAAEKVVTPTISGLENTVSAQGGLLVY